MNEQEHEQDDGQEKGLGTMQEKIRFARKLHREIKRGIRRVWTAKVEVHLMLSEFKRLKLYRLLDLPAAPRHAAKICAERRKAGPQMNADDADGRSGAEIARGHVPEARGRNGRGIGTCPRKLDEFRERWQHGGHRRAG